jgi:hypothetical protein
MMDQVATFPSKTSLVAPAIACGVSPLRASRSGRDDGNRDAGVATLQTSRLCRAFCFAGRFLAPFRSGAFRRGAACSMRRIAASRAGLSFSATGLLTAVAGIKTSLASVISETPE